MAGPYIHDRVKDTSTTTGTGTLTLANSAPTGFRTFGSILADGATVLYAIAHQSATEWETGVGTYTASGTTLARTTVLRSSNSNNAVSFSAGTKDVFCAPIVDHADKWLHVTNTMANLAALQAGRVVFPSDGFSLYRDTGSALVPWGPSFPFTEPVSGNYAWINQGSATITTTYGGVALACSSNGGAYSAKIRKKSAPATPYTITAAFVMAWEPVTTAGNFYGGLTFRQSSDGKLHSWYIAIKNNTVGTAGIHYENDKWTNATTFSAGYVGNYSTNTVSPVQWLRIADDGTNRICSISADGQNWVQVHSVGRTDFITADEVGFFINPYSVAGCLTLLSWKEA